MDRIFYGIFNIIGTCITQVVLFFICFRSCPTTTLETKPQPLLSAKEHVFFWIKNIWRDEWWDFVIMRSIPRYFLAFIRSFWVLFTAIRRSLSSDPMLVQLNDKQLGKEMRENFCHLMKKVDDKAPTAVQNFAETHLDSAGHYVYLDCSFMGYNQNIKCYAGNYICGTLTVFKHDPTDLSMTPVAILITQSPTDTFWVTPSDKAWSIAKRFAFTTAHYLVTFNTHPLTHFPQDCVYYHLRESVPQDHWLRQLLSPHFRFSASVTDSVFYNKYTVFNTIGLFTWCVPFPSVVELLSHDLADYTWSPFLEEPSAETPHSIARELYHKTIQDFVEKIVSANCNSGEILDRHVTEWVEKLSKQLKGFPDVNTIRKNPQLLTQALTKIILIVSFDHTTDHWWIRMRDPTIIEWIIRTPPPQNAQDAGLPSKRTRMDVVVQDFFNWCLPFGIFTYVPLCDVTYSFEGSSWQRWVEHFMKLAHQVSLGKPLATVQTERKAAEDFRRELREAAKIAEKQRFQVPLEMVSASVEY